MVYDDNLISTASTKPENKSVKVELELREEFKTTASELYQVLTDENVSRILFLCDVRDAFYEKFTRSSHMFSGFKPFLV